MKIIVLLIFSLTACHRSKDPIPEPSPSPSPTPIVEETPTVTPTPTLMPPVPTATPMPTATPTPIPTVAPTPEPTPELPRAFCPNGLGSAQIITMAEFQNVTQLRMRPCETTAFTVITAPLGRSEVILTQGQQPATPANSTTEFYVSKTPGLIQNDGTPCYVKTVFDNNNQATIYTQPVPLRGWFDQTSLGNYGCWAPASEGPWYVNVRWAYHVCTYSECGFSMQWARGGW